MIGLKNLVFTITHPFITHPRRGHDSSKNFWMNVPSEISPSVSRRVIGREGKCNGMFKFAKVIIGGGRGVFNWDKSGAGYARPPPFGNEH